jgi:hypothetical protein
MIVTMATADVEGCGSLQPSVDGSSRRRDL